MVYILIVLTLTLISIAIALFFIHDKLNKFLLFSLGEYDNFSDVNVGLSDYELNKIEREKEFDERIELLRQDLINSGGTRADELHPNVKNLPHDSVKTNYNPVLEIEVAD